ncbi:hypothetical protein GCM10009861_10690 [Neomicrococcus aestuarii]
MILSDYFFQPRQYRWSALVSVPKGGTGHAMIVAESGAFADQIPIEKPNL